MTPVLLTVLGTILVAAIGVAGSALSFYLTKRHEEKAKWQQEKLNHYRVLMSALSDLVGSETDKHDAGKRFALAVNTIALIAPGDVIAALMAFVEESSDSHVAKQEKLNRLLLAIRQDIGLSSSDDVTTFSFHLFDSTPRHTGTN